MTAQTLIKQPSEIRSYVMDFSPLLGAGETLTAASSVTAAPSGLTLVGSPTVSGTFAAQTVSGGTAGQRYKITYLVTTSDGNTLEAEGILAVKEL